MLTVSNYHYIRPNFNTPYPSIFGVTPEAFQMQLQLLKNEGDYIHPKDLLANYETILHSKDHFIFITFDDGLKEQYDYALPILDQLNIPAVFFANSINYEEKKVSTVHKIHLLRSIVSPETILENLSKTEINPLSSADKLHAQTIYRYDDAESATLKYLLNFKMSFAVQEQVIREIFDNYFEEKEIVASLYMKDEMLKDLAQRGYLGSHTHRHLPLGLLDSENIQFELEHSKSFFENLTGTSIAMISYPYGTSEVCTNEVVDLTKKAGYTLGFTTQRGINDATNDALLLNRFDCNDLVGGKNFKQ